MLADITQILKYLQTEVTYTLSQSSEKITNNQNERVVQNGEKLTIRRFSWIKC